MKKVALALAVVVSLSISTLSTLAHAVETDPSDCPPGSVNKTENGMTWCEPSVCENDSNCLPNEVCRPMALCVQIGTISGDGGATANNKASRLIATGRCAAEKKCPNTTTCSDKSRCIEKTKADRMGLLTPAPSASATPAGDAKKSTCGCTTVGDRTTDGNLVIAVSALCLGLALSRRKRPQAESHKTASR